ncbi:MAG: rhodanese-like domain-containing protein [Alphaproteobacteria bacterium]|nr:rhodanese-like domain-containing protein [Alphaproteobacteria bacterium]
MNTVELREIDAGTLKSWLDGDKAVVIDIREPDEYVREHIPESRLVPLSAFDSEDFAHDRDKIGVFHCSSGNRTCEAASRILSTGFKEVYQLQGGLQAWKQAGFPVNFNRKAPISIMRQVQITAGSMVVLGVLLGVLVSPWFVALSAFVGAGLMFAGISGTCALASALSLMPWNRLPDSISANPSAQAQGA